MHRLRPYMPLFVSLLLLAAIGFAAMDSQNNLLFWVFGVLASAIGVSIVVSHLVIRSISVRRLDPKHGAVGEPMVVHYAVTNRSRFLPGFNVRIEEVGDRGEANWERFTRPAEAWVLHVAPGETVHGEAVFWPRARGEVRFDTMRISTNFPFGMVYRSRTCRQSSHTLVFPRLYQLKRGVLDAVVPIGPAGLRLSNKAGGGDDYFGLREYRPGDSRRQIAWKRSASTGDLVIRERTMPSPPRIRLALNLGIATGELSRAGGNGVSPRQLEERAISLTATMIESCVRSGYEVGLAVIGFDVPVTPLRSNHWHVEKIMGALAALDLDQARIAFEHTHFADSERAATVVIHPGVVDPSVMRHAGWHFSATQLVHLVERRSPEDLAATLAERSATERRTAAARETPSAAPPPSTQPAANPPARAEQQEAVA